METDNENIDLENNFKKRDIDEHKNNQNTKKARLFSAKEFRKQLNSGDKLTALKQFLNVITESKTHDYVFDYLENGGNCLELLQTLETDSHISPVIVFDLVTHLLLKINTQYTQYHNSAYESCRYLINNYTTVIHKMIGLSSSKEERRICLKLLTAMVTFAPNLAKDVLLNVKFHSANIDLLTKHTGEEKSVRDGFIHFLTAFLVNGHYPTLSILLEKTGLLTSIIGGLQYDKADTVCIVITAMKNHILENPSVYKTAKMVTFNTSVVRDIVNLYNWKGPQGLKAKEKNKNYFEVDKYAKSRVSECVHDFLMVLCTSHKHGVIFKDPLVGLGKKNQNSLMYTVLESLDRPWEHSYAGQLVVKICRACPDLTKTMWATLKPFLEPRLTEKWLNAVKFAKVLLKELEPGCMEFAVKELSVAQLAQIIQFLVAPFPILKTIIPETKRFERQAIKQHVVLLIFEMLESASLYLSAAKTWLNIENYKKLKSYMSSYIAKMFPDAQLILDQWEITDSESDSGNFAIPTAEYLHCILDVLNLYTDLAPGLLDTLSSSGINLKEFLMKTQSLENSETALQMKMVNIFFDFDCTMFLPKRKLFAFVLPLLLKFYHETADGSVLAVLQKLLKNSGVFEACDYEINIWLNGILNIENFDENVANDFVNILKLTSENMLEYQQELSELKCDNDLLLENYSDVIENLMNGNAGAAENMNQTKHRHLSPLIIGFFQYLMVNNNSKSMKKYSDFVLLNLFHAQTSLEKFDKVAKKYADCLSAHMLEYIDSWSKGHGTILKKMKGKLTVFHNFSREFLGGTLGEFKDNLYPDFYSNLLQTSTFYFSNLSNSGNISEVQGGNFENFVKFLIREKLPVHLETILGNSNISKNFSLLHLDKNNPSSICTKIIFSVVKELINNHYKIENYLKIYRDKIVKTVLKIINRPEKYNKLTTIADILQVFNLDYDQCLTIIQIMSDRLENLNSLIVFDVLCYCMNQISTLCNTNSELLPLEKLTVRKVTSYFVALNKKDGMDASKFSAVVKKYLEVFPHNMEDIDEELFNSILRIKEYNKDHVSLCVFLLERDRTLFKNVEDNIEDACEKKGVLLPILKVLLDNNAEDKLLKSIYEKFEPALLKALQKPQKAGQHFHHSSNVCVLLEKFMPLEKCKSFLDKVQKFEVSEVFHAKLLESICLKVIRNEVTDKQINNMILMFIHLQMNLFKRKTKSDDDVSKLALIFNNVLTALQSKIDKDKDLKSICDNDTVKVYCKFCLKFGVSGRTALLKVVANLMKLLSKNLELDDARFTLDMLLSHSEIFDVILGEHSDCKLEILSLILVLCENWNELMERNHVAILLAAYRAKVNRCDRTILALLKMYEQNAEKTKFYDFKPFLWGRAAATHYSVRSKIENALLRQPKMGDVLDILQEDWVKSTIVNYPLKERLRINETKEDIDTCDAPTYDLAFLLPLFSQLLAPEQEVKTYKFTRSGALSLTVVGLAGEDEEVRKAACHVLARFHFHVEARQGGKDNLLWLRYVEALCKGTALLPNFKLNNFSAIFFAKMALILTQPRHVMYYPLSRYLTVKFELDFGTVPELYTFLHSSDVNYKEHRHFILEILKNGSRTERDLTDFLRSMAYKLFSELYSSCLADAETKLLILDVVEAVCKIPSGVKILCEHYSFLSQLLTVVANVLNDKDAHLFLSKIVKILLLVVKTRRDKYSNYTVFNTAMDVIKSDVFSTLTDDCSGKLFEVLHVIFDTFPELFTVGTVNVLLEKTSDKYCKYMSDYGCKFINRSFLDGLNDKYYYLRLVFFKCT